VMNSDDSKGGGREDDGYLEGKVRTWSDGKADSRK
jgi:hypothetical protein